MNISPLVWLHDQQSCTLFLHTLTSIYLSLKPLCFNPPGLYPFLRGIAVIQGLGDILSIPDTTCQLDYLNSNTILGRPELPMFLTLYLWGPGPLPERPVLELDGPLVLTPINSSLLSFPPPQCTFGGLGLLASDPQLTGKEISIGIEFGKHILMQFYPALYFSVIYQIELCFDMRPMICIFFLSP